MGQLREWHNMETAPRDGTTIVVPVIFEAHVFWDQEMQAWVTARTITVERVNEPKRWRKG